MNKHNITPPFISFFFTIFLLSACGSDTAQLQKSTPILHSFVSNIDENNSGILNVSLGKIEVLTAGSAPITTYILQGVGSSNFKISAQGEISTTSTTELNCTSFTHYNLTAQAQTLHGVSNKAQVLIQTNCLDVPIIKEITLLINAFTSGTELTFPMIRTGLVGNNTSSDIKSVEIKGDNSSNFTILSDPPRLFLQSSFGNTKKRYDYQIRSINTNNKIGPFSRLTIFIQ